MMLSVVTFEPHAVVPEHAHPHEQMGVLISGRAEFTVGGVTRVLGPGDLLAHPRRRPAHGRRPRRAVVALDCFHPIREDYL
jgi:quercetin dioxygenase-like cupin family protein